MKRSSLPRKTPLQSHTRLQSHTGLKRSPMKHHRSKQARLKDFSPSVRAIVMERSDGMCELCHMRRIAHLHHVVFRSQQGTGELSNAIGLCLQCHEIVHAHRAMRELAVQKAKELAESNKLTSS